MLFCTVFVDYMCVYYSVGLYGGVVWFLEAWFLR